MTWTTALSATDPLGNTTRTTYGAMRRVLSVTDPRGNSITNSYDDQGNLLSVRDALGGVTSYTYDQNGQPVDDAKCAWPDHDLCL